MNGQIRAVRAAERQLRGLPAAAAAILRAEGVPQRFEPALGWADAAPLGALAGATSSIAARREGTAEERRRGMSPDAPRAEAASGGATAVAGGALTGVRRAVEGIGEVVTRGAAGAAGGSGTTRGAASGIGAALAGDVPASGVRESLAGRGAAGDTEDERPVFSLGALGRAASAVASAAADRGGRRAGRPGDAGTGAALAAALGGPPEPGAPAAVGAGVGIAAVQAAGAAATVVEAMVPAMEGISRRIEAAGARLAEARAAEAAAATSAAGVVGQGSALAAMAAAATRAFSGLTPPELAAGRPPALEGQIEPASAAPAVPTAASAGAAPQVIDAEWVVAVVGDALLEQARRQGIDLT